MKISKIHIQNFRSFKDETIEIDNYTCFVGPNGAGKSSILAALNVFFQDQSGSSTDVSNLEEEDFFLRHTDIPIRITITFRDFCPKAREELTDYIRQDQLIITAEAKYDPEKSKATVIQYGQRLGMQSFRKYFEAVKDGSKVTDLKTIFSGLRKEYSGIGSASTKDAMADALRAYESDHPDECNIIPSSDDFYGIRGTGKLASFIQWVYVPAVKDAGDEELEAKNTALGKLIARAVANRSDFDNQINQLKDETLKKYRDLMEANQSSLDSLSDSIARRLASWANPNVKCALRWQADPAKAVSVIPPVAGVKTGERDFFGSLSRMGHGLQRSYLLALLQELAASDSNEGAPTLLLGCEEPELYQHPPQAQHLATVFQELSERNNQILVTSHSPYFVSGQGFEQVRPVRRNPDHSTKVSHSRFADLCATIDKARGEHRPTPVSGMTARIHQSLQVNIAEMFFCNVPVLVEGLEDVAYITTHLHLTGKWDEFRRLGCHLIPVHRKDQLIEPLALCLRLKIPCFTVFDADGNTEREDHRIRQEKDNITLIKLLGADYEAFPPDDLYGERSVIWANSITDRVEEDFGECCEALKEKARQLNGHIKSLEKKALFIADFLRLAYDEKLTSQSLENLSNRILEWAKSV